MSDIFPAPQGDKLLAEIERLRATNADLLEACKHAELWFTLSRTEIEHDIHTLDTLRAVIAKATGDNSLITTPDGKD